MGMYPSNSDKSREAGVSNSEPKVTGKVKIQKKSQMRKIAEAFCGSDIGNKNVGEYLIYDVLIPGIRDVFVRGIKNSLDVMFYNQPMNNGQTPISYGGYTPYNTLYPSYRTQQTQPKSYARPYSFNGLYFENQNDANIVLNTMRTIISREGSCSVQQMYEVASKSEESVYTDRDWGWTNLDKVSILVDISEGYYIDLPNPISLK